MTDDRKNEPPLRLDMSFGEALARLTRVKPSEVAESVERSKTKKPPGDDPPRQPRRSKRSSIVPSRERKPGAT